MEFRHRDNTVGEAVEHWCRGAIGGEAVELR